MKRFIPFVPRPLPVAARLSLAFVGPALLLFAAGATPVGGSQPVLFVHPAPKDPPKVADQAAFDQSIKPLLDKYCISCHGAQSPSGGINLTAHKTVAEMQKNQVFWRKAVTQIRERTMPPRGVPQPKSDERDLMASWLADTLDNVDESLLPKNPGRVLIHRLNREEYNNTVRDLLGVNSRPADKFPADGGGGGGFDNNADTLFIPPVLMERYLEAATAILTEAKPERLFIARPAPKLPARDAARKTLTYHATRAFRRPVEPAEVERLVGLWAMAMHRGDSYESAVRFAMKAVLVSPHFMFRIEPDRSAGKTQTDWPLNDYELASRLSYFLWSSMPDDTLFMLAQQKKLRDPKVINQQVKRMLESPKARAFADGFAGQWLRTRELFTAAQPDTGKFPAFTPTLRQAMYDETTLFFESVVRENRSLMTLIDANYTFVNEELAKHYGIDGVTGTELRRVSLTDGKRGGLLTMGSVLTLTSYPQRTSPVLRGKWILSELLGTPPPPPPPVVATLPPDDRPDKEGLTFRQRLEKHRGKPECASCHARIDPPGFALENFDVIGRWREDISGTKVDASGELSTGEKFSGPAELKKTMLLRKDDYMRNLTEKMLSYALGRGLHPYDLPAVRKIMQAVEKDGYKSQTLVTEVVKSYPFQYRSNQ
jgi:mono/diheme cytochrome c family protein